LKNAPIRRGPKAPVGCAVGLLSHCGLARVGSGATRQDRDSDSDRTTTYSVGTATSDGQRFRVLLTYGPKPNIRVTSRKVEPLDFAEGAKGEAKEAKSKDEESAMPSNQG
jgi:hypothetical protein